MKIQRVAVIGAGAMGSGIAQVLSQAGLEVILKDVKREFVDNGLAKIKKMYESRVKKEVLSQSEADYLYGQIKGQTDYEGFKDVDLVIEAALEQIEIKIEIFKELDKLCPEHTILASNTSALSISEIASHTKRPHKVVGVHFFNPAQTMKLVEVIPGLRTAPETVEKMIGLCRDLHKIAVRVEECPGFLVNRLLFPYMNEAVYALSEGGNIHEIDQAVVDFGLPMGPFTLFDMTGIDVCAHVTNFLHQEYGQRFATAPLMNKLMEGKFFGQKTGAGFYLHEAGQVAQKGVQKKENPELAKLIAGLSQKSSGKESSFDVYRLILPMFNEAVYALQEKVVEAKDVDLAMQWGCGLNRGLLSLADEKGLSWCLEKLEHYQGIYGERFRPAWLLRKMVRAGAKNFNMEALEPVSAR
jgi:3-hydroxyacyl-CoA dehydrogenase